MCCASSKASVCGPCSSIHMEAVAAGHRSAFRRGTPLHDVFVLVCAHHSSPMKLPLSRQVRTRLPEGSLPSVDALPAARSGIRLR